MAKSTSQSTVIAELARLAEGGWDDARNVTPKPKGIVQLPSGLQGAIGKVVGTDLRMSKPNEQGQYPQAVIKFVVCEPEEYKGIVQTKNYNFFQSKTANAKTVAQKLADFANDLQLLGQTTSGVKLQDIPIPLAKLSKEKPCFKFNTWKAEEEGSWVNIFIQGLAVGYSAPDDITPIDAEELVSAAEAGVTAPAAGNGKPKKPKAPPKKAAPVADDGIEEVSDVEEVTDGTPIPEVELYVPEVGDRFFLMVSGEQHTAEVIQVLEAEEKCIVLDETINKKCKVGFQKVRDDNPD